MKKNILLVFTGGTIGSQLSGDTMNTDGNAGFKLLQRFTEQDPKPDSVNFKTLQPLQILSENLHPSHWPQIIAAIEGEDLGQFDGIIVTHGTDSLAFSAAALSLYFNGLSIPLLLVSSDLPLDNPQANGVANFLCAVEFIRQLDLAGVFVPYRNPGQVMQIHLGARLSSCLPLSSDFISVQSQAWMRLENGQFQSLQNLAPSELSSIALKPDFSKRILLIRPYPGLDYSTYNLDAVDAVLHDLYHSGTACASSAAGEQYSLVEFVKRCAGRGIKIYLAPALYSESAYASTRELLDCGAEMIWNTSLEAAYAKLLLAYGNFDTPQAIYALLVRNLAHEQL
ncbi:asparaginase [Methylomonas rosea]|uniref:Asparaginase domain-containing protein n=1 Tax=Methylomonas rosea TaxID=2952227 RepID=A0ABT1TND9_9GAMM|nr:asparaginase domain-containing protein [Methylomonas sp. WSC-7]MCQ8115997.1 asparaginase domain-containing protein [Methylomonas sp. WSC-7]